jgi:TM2 domain-containing membrane protein YozV
MFCKECGAEINDKAVVCPKCGCSTGVAAPAQGMSKRVTAALIALFLGGFGIHKFYLGKTLQGVLMLVFCWTYIPSLIALVEAIIYFTQTDEAFNEKQFGTPVVAG